MSCKVWWAWRRFLPVRRSATRPFGLTAEGARAGIDRGCRTRRRAGRPDTAVSSACTWFSRGRCDRCPDPHGGRRHGRPELGVNSWAGRPLPAAGLPGAGRLADAWMDAVLGTSYVAMRRADLRDYLTDLADDLFIAVTDKHLDRSIPRGVGAAMVAVHFTDTISLELSLLVLGRELGRAASTPGRRPPGWRPCRPRWPRATPSRCRSPPAPSRSASGWPPSPRRRSAEHARWTSEARFQAVFGGALIGISVIDTAGCILEVNRALSALLGLPRPTSSSDARCSRSCIPMTTRTLWVEVKEVLAGSRDSARMTKCDLPQGRQLDLDRRRALPGPRRRRHAAVRRQHGRGHHRAATAAGPAAPPGRARPAHRAAQPHPVLRPPGGGCWPPRTARSGCATSTWTGSRRSTTPSATTSGTSCCRPLPTGSRPRSGGTWWPGWAATSSWCSSSTPATSPRSAPSWCAARRRCCRRCAGRSGSAATASWSRPASGWCSGRTSAPVRPS